MCTKYSAEGRAIINYTCDHCKKAKRKPWLVQVVFRTRRENTPRWGWLTKYAPEGEDFPVHYGPEGRTCANCRVYMTRRFVEGKVDESTKCSASCWNATSHNCNCSCGGDNHGRSHRV